MQNKSKRLRERILNVVDELKQSNFYQLDFKSVLENCLHQLAPRRIERILCYGLGTFSNGVDIASRFQLALLILLYEHLKELGEPLNTVIEAYDPSFEPLDLETLLSFSDPEFSIIEENEYCGREIETANPNHCSIVFMPHLDKYLYNNLLGMNWSVEGLSSVVVLGNSFQEMIDSETSSECLIQLHYLNQLVQNFPSKNRQKKRHLKSAPVNKSDDSKALVELSIDDGSFQHSDIFNSLALHLISRKWLKENSSKIKDSRLDNWTCVTSCHTEDVWTND